MEEGLKKFQEANCVGCRFVDEKAIGNDGCCQFSGHLLVIKEHCYSRVTKGDDPKFACSVCKETVRANAVTDQAYESRQCQRCYTALRS